MSVQFLLGRGPGGPRVSGRDLGPVATVTRPDHALDPAPVTWVVGRD